jgi:hypothetical protein
VAETFVEQMARLRAAGVRLDSLPRQMRPHAKAGELERPFVCTVCGRTILVGPCFGHIDPETFVGIVCGCFERQGGAFVVSLADSATGAVVDGASPGPDGGAGTAGNGRERATSGEGVV